MGRFTKKQRAKFEDLRTEGLKCKSILPHANSTDADVAYFASHMSA